MSIVAAAAAGASARVRVTVGGGGVPSVPQNLSATAASASQINLTWDASTGSPTHYNIYRDDVLVDTSATNSYSDTGLDGLTRYTYEVSAENGAGESDLSASDTADTDAPAGTIWVSPAGGGNGETQGAPTTLATANGSVAAGGMVAMLGGNYNTIIDPTASGTSGNPITFKDVPSSTQPVITGGDVRAIDLTGLSYIRILGIDVHGGQAPGIGATAANFDFWVRFSGTHHCEIAYCNFTYANDTGIVFAGASASNDNWLHHNVFDHVGSLQAVGAAQDLGEQFDLVNGTRNLIEHNLFRHGGHNLLRIQDVAEFNVVRFNDFYNYWGDISGYEIGGTHGYTAGAGQAANRCMVLKVCPYTLVEWNVFRFVRRSSDTTQPNAVKTEGENHIVRRNLLFDTSSDGFSQVVRSATPVSTGVHHYHNSLWGVGTTGPGGGAWSLTLGSGGSAANADLNVWKNNAIHNSDSPQIICSVGTGDNNSNIIQGNSFSPATGQNMQIGATTDSVANWDGDFGGEIDGNITAASPSWVGGDTPSDFAGFQLEAGSALIDSGVHLTVTVGAGSGTSMTVADAGYFLDGWGIAQLQGDEIMTASGATARITAINYDTNVLTLDTSISWDDGEGVSLPFTGTGPDIGAREFGIDVPAS